MALSLIPALVAAGGFLAGGAPAGQEGLGLGVSPVSLVIPAGAHSAATTISNPSAEAVTVQVRVFAWSSQGAEDVYTPTSAISFSPAIFRLEPGRRQLVRLLLRQPAIEREGAFRLVVDQLPAASTAEGLRMPVRMLLPVFAEAPVRAAAASPPLRWTATYAPATQMLTLSVANTGDRRVRLVDLAYRTAGARIEVRTGLAGYALAGQIRSWTVNAATRPAMVRVEAKSDGAPVMADVPVASR